MVQVSTQAPQIQGYIRGDSRTVNLQVYESDSKTPFNLTGCEVFLTFNTATDPPADGSDNTASLKKSTSTFASPTSGLATIQLLNTDTQSLPADTYFYDVQLKDSAGNITSLASNTWEIIDDISTRIS